MTNEQETLTDAPQIELEDLENYNPRTSARQSSQSRSALNVCHWKGVTTAYTSAALFFAGYLILSLLHFGVLVPKREIDGSGGELQERDAMIEHYNGDKTLVKIYSVEPTIYADDKVLAEWQRKLETRTWTLLANFLCMFGWFSLIPTILAFCRSLGGFSSSRQLAMAVCFAFGALAVALQLLITMALTDSADSIASYLFNHDTHSKMAVDEEHRWAEQENRLNDTSAWSALTISYTLIESSMSWIYAADNLALICGFGCAIHAALERRDGTNSNRLFIVFSILGCMTCFGTFLLDVFRYTAVDMHAWFAAGKLFEGCVLLPLWLVSLGTILAKRKNWTHGAGDSEAQPLTA